MAVTERTLSAQACARGTLESTSRVGVLSISSHSDDHSALAEAVAGLPCRFEAAGSCRSALWRLKDRLISIVVCERDLPDGSWRDILEGLRSLPDQPLLIVTSAAADAHLWAEVLNLGGYDVIAKPFDPREARHVLETACLEGGWRVLCRHAAVR
jgi:DNA-binding NtrC family response regulator